MSNNKLKELKEKIDKIIILWNEWVLTWEKAQELQKELRKPNLLIFFKNEIIKWKFEKLQNSIDTLWTDRHWYTWWWVFEKRNELIKLELWESNKIDKQKYFWEWQESDIYKYLKSLFPTAKEKIMIYDNYLDIEILKILSYVNKNVKIQILTTEKSKTEKFEKQVEAFKILYEIELEIKYITTWKHPSHDRFYVIDNQENIYSMWVSIWKKMRATMFHPIEETEWKKIINDITNWWIN